MGRGKGVRGKDSYHLDNLDKVDSYSEEEWDRGTVLSAHTPFGKSLPFRLAVLPPCQSSQHLQLPLLASPSYLVADEAPAWLCNCDSVLPECPQIDQGASPSPQGNHHGPDAQNSVPVTMISDNYLFVLAVFLGSCAMLLIILYHFLEVNAQDDDESPSEKAKAKASVTSPDSKTTKSTSGADSIVTASSGGSRPSS
ncbi:hypothetical protein VTN49DRAFT_4437 [Thermomyces lanuginosus]|uniref:uncharacterized protein n=1 Tax=Thermomyces lanuginosus TaxID=5541 RepID=UPI003742FF9E